MKLSISSWTIFQEATVCSDVIRTRTNESYHGRAVILRCPVPRSFWTNEQLVVDTQHDSLLIGWNTDCHDNRVIDIHMGQRPDVTFQSSLREQDVQDGPCVNQGQKQSC